MNFDEFQFRSTLTIQEEYPLCFDNSMMFDWNGNPVPVDRKGRLMPPASEAKASEKQKPSTPRERLRALKAHPKSVRGRR